MRGRKPKPTSQQVAEGDPRKRGKNKLQAALNAEPPATKGFPPCPSHLSEMARDAWIFLADEIAKMNLDCRPDALMLEGAALNYARAVRADMQVQRDGIVIEDAYLDKETGERVVLKVKAHPAVAISNQAWRQVRSFCSEFGLSPVSRTRLSVDNKDKLPDLSEILNKPRESKTAEIVN